MNDGGGPVAGPDGQLRCPWSLSTPEYVKYHDDEWGMPVRDDDALFERLCLEAFQSGLSWAIILRKRDHFRKAFFNFDIERVAALTSSDVDRLVNDERIVRNRRKIEATIDNARAALALIEERGSFGDFIWSFAPERAEAPRTLADIPSSTEASKSLAGALKRHGFRWVGPTTVYATMQACGLVDDHLFGCAVRERVERERNRF